MKFSCKHDAGAPAEGLAAEAGSERLGLIMKRLLANRWVRRLLVAVLVVASVVGAGMAYRLFKTHQTLRTIAFVVHKTRINVIDPNGLTVGEPFSIGLKPQWWHSQWLIVPATTPAKKVIVLRVFVKHSFFNAYLKRVEIGCMQHDPKPSDEAKAFGVEASFNGVDIKNVPPDVVVGERPVDLRRWLPGSFEP